QEPSEAGGITLSAPRTNLSVDNCNGTQSQQATTHNQRFLKKKPGKNYQLCIWCISYSLRLQRLCKIRQMNDRYLLPRDQDGNVISKLESWEFGNCSEMNAWTYLCQWRPDLQIMSRTITVYSREIKEPCKNCKAIQNWLTN